MNLALGAFLITLISFTGLAFRIGFLNRNPKDTVFLRGLSVTDSLLLFAIPMILIHLAGISLIQDGFSQQIDFLLLIELIRGTGSDALSGHENLFASVRNFSLYLLGTYLTGYALGWVVQPLLIRIIDGTDPLGLVEKLQDEHAQQFVDVLVEVKGEAIMYSGFVSEITYKPRSPEPEALILNGVLKRKWSVDTEQSALVVPEEEAGQTAGTTRRATTTLRPIAGERFLVFFHQIKNINVISRSITSNPSLLNVIPQATANPEVV